MQQIGLDEVNLLAQMCLGPYKGYEPGQLLTSIILHLPKEKFDPRSLCKVDALGVVILSDRGEELIQAKSCVSNWMKWDGKLEEMIRDEYHYSCTENQGKLWDRKIGLQPHYYEYYGKNHP